MVVACPSGVVQLHRAGVTISLPEKRRHAKTETPRLTNYVRWPNVCGSRRQSGAAAARLGAPLSGRGRRYQPLTAPGRR